MTIKIKYTLDANNECNIIIHNSEIKIIGTIKIVN